MTTYNLYRWSVSCPANGYWAPEQRKVSLAGFRDQETKPVVTSSIKEINGKEITTSTGSVYILQDIDPEYLEWLNQEGIVYDPANPIKIKEVK
jgi:adenine-specific DNA methylase